MQASKDDNNQEVRKNAARALKAMGVDSNATVEHFVDALKGKDGDARTRAALALGGFGPQAKIAIPSLVLIVDDAKLSSYAIASLGRIGKDAVPALIKLLKHEKAKTRQATAKALGEMGPNASEAIPVLYSLAQAADESPGVREQAKAALVKLERKK
jgi:HEAT repeat protein